MLKFWKKQIFFKKKKKKEIWNFKDLSKLIFNLNQIFYSGKINNSIQKNEKFQYYFIFYTINVKKKKNTNLFKPNRMILI